MSMKLTPIEVDAIGEVMNISMGAAATAVSSMLDKQVIITIPEVEVLKVESINYKELEPALLVKIVYTEGINGSNVMVFSQRDMQLILNQLMGIDEPPVDDFVFDDLSMSAACEIMNQMMGSSATALSNFLEYPINISTPTAEIMKDKNVFKNAVGLPDETDIVSITFKIKIGNIMDSEFISIMSCELAREIITRFLKEPEKESSTSEDTSVPQNTPPMSAPQQEQPPMMDQSQQMAGQEPSMPQPPMMNQSQMMGQPSMMNQPPMMDQSQMMGQPQMMNQPQMMGQPQMMNQPQMMGQPQMMNQPQMMGQMGEQQGYYPPYPPNPYYPYPPYGMPMMNQPQMTVMNAQFPDFSQTVPQGAPMMNGNMGLIMNVPLAVTVEIGSAKRKIKDILDFNQGTVIELDKQAGSPVDIIVNGQLFAKGDVVVLDDNFGVRITEIIGTKELLDSLEKGTN